MAFQRIVKMRKLKGEFRLICETYSFYWHSEETYNDPDFGIIPDERDFFKIEVEYRWAPYLKVEPAPTVRLNDHWSIPDKAPVKAAHYKRIYEAIAYGLTPENLFSRIYLFKFPNSSIKDFRVELKTGGGVFLDKFQKSYFKDFEEFAACLDFVKETIASLDYAQADLEK